MLDSTMIVLIISWLVYFGLHSLLASIGTRQFVADHFPRLMPAYRLMFNLLAVLLLAVPLGVSLADPGPWLWRWSGVAFYLSLLLSAAAIAGFLWSLKYYDMREFLGLRQLSERNASVDDQEQFQLSSLHRWVRHPWYFFALILIWTRDMNAPMLVTAILLTLYFIIGSRLEEQKLIRYHGEVYQRYRQLVPGLVPLPWKYLRQADLEALINSGE